MSSDPYSIHLSRPNILYKAGDRESYPIDNQIMHAIKVLAHRI